jgi:AraC-like DNA-binding protein
MNYSNVIHNAIIYIDQHLCEPITVDTVAKYYGVSKYHFLRVFKCETGKGLFEHIQCRRLSQAAKILLSTEETIMDVALLFQFESQEAFTRAFKREFNLPPGRYRKAMSNLIGSKEFQNMSQNNKIPGWIVTGSAPKAYEIYIDHNNCYNGTRSLVLKNKEEDLEEGTYCTVMQQFKAKSYIGKRVRFSGYVKSQDVTGWGALWMRVDSITTNIIKIDNMQNRPIKGNTDWNYYSVVLDIPENSAIINIGMLLYSTGTLYMDNIVFETVDRNVSTTDVDLSYDMPEKPVNLSLDDDRI